MKTGVDKFAIALRQINASCAAEISADAMLSCINGENDDSRWRAHVVSFLEELPVELIHDMALSGIFSFEALSDALNRWECTDGPTTRWIREMAALSVETAA